VSFDDKYASFYYDEIGGYIKPSHKKGYCKYCSKETNWAILRFNPPIDTPAGYDYVYCCSEECLRGFKAELVEEIVNNDILRNG
jgi:hypothetical protein